MRPAPTDVRPTTAPPTGFDPGRLERVGAAIDADVHAGRYDGAALRVFHHGEEVLVEHRGWAERRAGRPMEPGTAFVSLSIGKQFTNAVLLSFVERGLLALHAPVAEVLPRFGARGKGRITLAQLLTHTSGVHADVPALPPEVLADNAAVAEFAYASKPQSLPGERVSYSIVVAHAVLGEMLLEVDGRRRSFTDLMQDELFTPVGMRDTSVGLRADLGERLAPLLAAGRGYEEPGMFTAAEVEGLGALVAGVPGVEVPAGGYVTTVDDVGRFAELLRNGGELDGFRLLSPAMIDFATHNRTGSMPSGLFDYAEDTRGWQPFPAFIGLGFFLRGTGVLPGPFPALASPRTFGGWGSGGTCFWIDPERALSFALLTTGVMEDSRHVERLRRLGDMVLASMT